MGANSIRSFTISFALMGITIIYFVPSTRDTLLSLFPMIGVSEDTVRNLVSNFYEKDSKFEISKNERNIRLFTPEELSKYDGGPDSLGLFLAILGEVFDVTKGAQHYKPGSSYDFFAGRDASRSYITGMLEESIEPDNLAGIEESSYASLSDWLSFYKDEYPYIGKVIGRYYDQHGNPTAELEKILKKIQESTTNKWLEQNEKEIFPPCNSEWSKERGSRVWCSNKSGGVDRSWVGVPRKLYKAGKDARCVCVRDLGPPSESPDVEKHNNRGDLEHPNLQQYPDCPISAVSCKVDHP